MTGFTRPPRSPPAAEHRRERALPGPAKAQSRLAMGCARKLVPAGMREHDQVAAAHDQRLALAFAVHPRLAASNEVEDRAGCTCGIERPLAAVAALHEDRPAQSQRLQNVRQQVRIRRFGYEISTFQYLLVRAWRCNLRPPRGTGKACLA